MKRPKWALFWIGTIWLCSISEVAPLKATSLIFSKPKSTTTETPVTSDNDDQASQNSTSSEPSAPDATSSDGENTESKPRLTGIPQIDYKWDPNLPRELNGYNLTDYPFYATVPPPEEFDFKCDGLHDGFYASIPHKCQVYHHCLFGVRYDFLCANYTAFDQKTFICHFVSEVDCNNSAKYFHRNDALYQAASTTTTTTTTPAPPPTQATVAPIPPIANAPRNPYPPSGGGGYRRRRPGTHRRRRPQYEYYDDELEEYQDDYYDDEPVRGRGNRKRVRPRPRDPEYDEYEDDYVYDRRGPYNDRRRPMGDRRRPHDDRRVMDDRPYKESDRRKPPTDRRKKLPEDVDTDERRSFDERRRPYADDYDVRRPAYNERRKTGQRRPYDDRRYMADDDEVYDRRKPIDEEDDGDRRYKPSKETSVESEESKAQIKPISASAIYSKPRAPPIIRRPVPVNERDKYDYTPTSNSDQKPAALPPVTSDEYDDEYEYDPPANKRRLPPPSTNRKPVTDPPPKYGNNRPRPNDSKRPTIVADEMYEDESKPKGITNGRRPTNYRDDSSYRDDRNRPTPKRPSTDISTEDDIRPSKGRRPYDEDVYTPGVGLKNKRRPLPTAVDEDYDDDRKILETTSRFRKPFRPVTTSKPRFYGPPRTTSTERTKKPEVLPDDEFYDEPFEYEQDYSSPSPSIKRPEGAKDKKDKIDERVPIVEKKETVIENRNNVTRNDNPLLSNKREPYVKIVKRPFLPSRGGNPLAARGLQPVGSRAQELSNKKVELPPTVTSTTTTTTTTTEKNYEEPPSAPGNYKLNFRTRGRFTNPGIESDYDSNNAKYEYVTDVSSTSKVPELAPIIPSEDSTLRPHNNLATTPQSIRVNLRGNFNVGSGRNFGPNGPSESSEAISKPSSEEIDDTRQTPSKESKSSETSLVSYKQNSQDQRYEKTIAHTPADVSPNRGSVQYHNSGYQQNPFRNHIPEITTQKPKEPTNAIKNPLDLIENEYDVTLNDALNPTLPNIPSRNSPSGFILQRENDYTYSGYTRPRYYNLEPLNQASSDFTYQIQQTNTNNNRNLQQYQQSTQFLPTYQTTNYNTRQIRGHQQYTSNF